LSDQEQNKGGRGVKVAVQLVGFAIGIALLWWCVHLALSEENREQLEHLKDAPRGMIAGLLGLGVATITLNGLMLWVVLLPTRRLVLPDVLGVNALATLLAYLPFKLSVLSRFVLHNRRDGMPIMRIGAWLAAFLVITLATMGPFAVAAVVFDRVSVLWVVTAGGLLVVGYGSLIGLSRVLRGAEGTARLRAMFAALRLKPMEKLIHTNAYAHLHDGFSMTADPRSVVGGGLLRVMDLGVYAARFWIAAEVLGTPISVGDAVMMAVVYFLIGVASPFGVIGTREGGTTAILAGVMVLETNEIAAMTLLVGATEAIAALACGAIGVAWLRPTSLLTRRDDGEQL